MDTIHWDREDGHRLNQEYFNTGLIQQSFPLANANILHEIKSDYYNHFEQPIKENKQNGIFRIPYKITDAIKRIAHDDHINMVIKSITNGEPWVMWGSNIQLGTPNQAYQWHVDFESNNFPTVTVMIGVEGCSQENATICIPYTHEFNRRPGVKWHELDPEQLVEKTKTIDPRSDHFLRFKDFGNGMFYVFNAKTWHAGEISSSKERMLLILHYQKASDPRIPHMKDYSKGSWLDFPAPYFIEEGFEKTAEKSMYKVRKRKGLLWKTAKKIKRYLVRK